MLKVECSKSYYTLVFVLECAIIQILFCILCKPVFSAIIILAFPSHLKLVQFIFIAQSRSGTCFIVIILRPKPNLLYGPLKICIDFSLVA